MVSGPITCTSLIQDSDDDDEDGEEDGAADDGILGRRLEFGGRSPPPVQEDQSEPEMTDEEKEFQLVCSHNLFYFRSIHLSTLVPLNHFCLLSTDDYD